MFKVYNIVYINVGIFTYLFYGFYFGLGSFNGLISLIVKRQNYPLKYCALRLAKSFILLYTLRDVMQLKNQGNQSKPAKQNRTQYINL